MWGGVSPLSLHARNGDYPTPMNAWCPHRMVGACSGAAAAVTAGQVDFAVAMDTLGSVAVPAAYCGAFAFRFTHHPEVHTPTSTHAYSRSRRRTGELAGRAGGEKAALGALGGYVGGCELTGAGGRGARGRRPVRVLTLG